LRISIGGGGTDLPSYYREFGGYVISAAIKKYVYISINRAFFPGYFLKYSDIEACENYDSVKHPLIREALRMQQVSDRVEIVSIADVPGGTGLGSSGSFLVGLLHALHAYKRQPVTAQQLAQEAFDIEANRLGEPVGKQDHTIAAYGGILCQSYGTDNSVRVKPLRMSEAATLELRDSLMLFFVGLTRAASDLLQDQRAKTERQDRAIIESLHFTKQLGQEIERVLMAGEVSRFGTLMHEHWMRKRGRSTGMSSNRIDELYELALGHGGATGGKLVGAGGGGFLLFHTNDRPRLRSTMAQAGLSEMDFDFDFDGSVVLFRNL